MSSVEDRGISPTVGVALLIAIVVVIALISGTVLLSLSDRTDPAPSANIAIEVNDSDAKFEMVHRGGDTFDGDRVEILGVADPDRLSGRNISTGERAQIVPVNDTIEVVWHGEHETSHVIWEGSVPDVGVELEPATSTLDAPDIGGQGTNVTVTEGTDESVTVDVANTGDEPNSFEVSLDIGDEVTETTTTEELAGGQTETVTFENVTDDLPPDDHDVTVTVDNDSVSGTLTVEEPPSPEPALSNLDIAGQGATATITEGTDESIAVDVENVGEESGSFTVSLDIGTAESETATTSTLSVGQTETVTFEKVTGNLADSQYGVTAEAGNDSVSGTLTVEEPPPAAPSLDALDIAGQGTDATITEGTDEAVAVDVENVGGQSGSFTVSLDIGTAESETVTTSTLSVGQTETVTFEKVTGDLSTGDYGVSVAAGNDSVSGTLTVEEDLPDADRGCDWVDEQTNGGTDDIKIDGVIVDCDVITDKVIEVLNDGGVIGKTESRLKVLDADDARFWGDVIAEDVLNLQNGTITGNATSNTADVKLYEATVEGSVDAKKIADILDGTDVEGDVESDKDANVLNGSSVAGSVTSTNENAQVDESTVGGTVEATKTVEVHDSSSVGGDVISDGNTVEVFDSSVGGSVVTEGTVKLQGATVTGDVYAGALKCQGGSTVNGQDCDSYTPEDPDDY